MKSKALFVSFVVTYICCLFLDCPVWLQSKGKNLNISSEKYFKVTNDNFNYSLTTAKKNVKARGKYIFGLCVYDAHIFIFT